jgi:hypothetical protein
MGGGHKFHYPKWVWSPAGGWWANPPNWKRNTAIYVVVCCGIAAFVADYANKRTVSAYIYQMFFKQYFHERSR